MPIVPTGLCLLEGGKKRAALFAAKKLNSITLGKHARDDRIFESYFISIPPGYWQIYYHSLTV